MEFSLVSNGTDVVEGHGDQQPLSYSAGRTSLVEGLSWGHKEKDYFEVGSGSGWKRVRDWNRIWAEARTGRRRLAGCQRGN